MWWHRRRVYRWLVKFHNGKNVKLKSLRNECERNNITQQSDLDVESARTSINICEKHLNELRLMTFDKQRNCLTEQLKYYQE